MVNEQLQYADWSESFSEEEPKREKESSEQSEEEIFEVRNFDCEKKYPDAFYEQYIENFQPNGKKRRAYKFFKRLFDFTASLLGLIILSPIMLAIAIAIKCDSKGPVIFRQQRVGKGGKPFNCYKFRSMRTDTPHDCATSILEHPEQYYTRVGAFLRKTSLDELPQLWCCVCGTMSVIGYRPLVLTEKNCNGMRERLGVFEMRPGISGYSQVHGRDDVYYKNKAIMDAEYVKHATFWGDIKLIFETVAVVLKRKGNADNKQVKKTGTEKETGTGI